MEDPNKYYSSKEEPNQSCLLALRKLILDSHTDLYETRKWGMPCFCMGKKPICYLWTDKKTNQPYVLIVEGKRIDHPALKAGDRAKMKILQVDPLEDLPVSDIGEVLDLAIDLYLNDQ